MSTASETSKHDCILTSTRRNSRTDGLPALPIYRPLPSIPLDKENIPLRQPENPIIKKKSSLGAFRFKNFFQSSKTKETVSRISDLQTKIQPFPLSPTVHPNQPGHHAVSSDAYTSLHAHPHQSSIRSSAHVYSARGNAKPRLPLITTSVPRFRQYSSPYSAEPAPGSPHDALPYASGAGDGWHTPFPARSIVGPSKYAESPGYPFPAVAAHSVKQEPQDCLVVPADSARHERAPSAAFEYQEFETSLRNSGQLSIAHGIAEDMAESDKENDTSHLSIKSSPKPPMYAVAVTNRSYGSPRQAGSLRAQPSIESFRRQPLVETAQPLSIGRNYPRSRAFALADTNRQSVRQSNYGGKDGAAYKSSRLRSRDVYDSIRERSRDAEDIAPDFANLEVESIGDATADFDDSTRL